MREVELRALSGAAVAVPAAEVEALADQLAGALIAPADPGYDEARAVWNGMIDKRPGLIARCTGAADVTAAVDFARRHRLLVSVRGGGHNVSGNAVGDGGLVVDLSPIKGVRVDPVAGTARAGAGVTIGELDHETQAFGLAVPMGLVSRTGIAGLTLGGGIGWLRRRYGLSSDNLLAADVVLADGRLVRAGRGDPERAPGDPELLWALRGGGGNFGAVTSFEFRAHPVGPQVYFAAVMHQGATAPEALRFFRQWQATVPDSVSAFAVLWHAPRIPEIPARHHGRPIVLFAAVHCGTAEEGRRELRGLREYGSPIADFSGARPYQEVQQFFDEDFPPRTMRYYWKSRYLRELPDQAADLLVRLNEASPSPHSTLDVWQLGGAMGRVAADATAFGGRSAPYLLGIEANWEDPGADAACIAWAREVFEAVEPFAAPGQYANFPGFYEDNEALVNDVFGANMARLAALKRRYDPDNLFRLNHNIVPA